MASESGVPEWLPALAGFLLGAVTMRSMDFILPHLHPGAPSSESEGPHTEWRQSALLIAAITMHNIPEGLAIGVAFGAAALGDPQTAGFAGAVALALGIGLQNFPEGIAVSIPLRRVGMSRRQAFFWGQASALVEPVAGIVGFLAVSSARPLLPYALSFAAGAMIFIVVEEIIPEAQRSGHRDFATIGAILGFAVMMTLDVALG
jgi:ZIP family zinc transporter